MKSPINIVYNPPADSLSAIRQGAEISAMKPYLDHEIASMQKAVILSVLSAVNSGSLTPEIAFAKWMEYIAYQKLLHKFDQRIKVGASLGTTFNLDNKEQ